MWQSCVEIEHYSVAFFQHISVFIQSYLWKLIEGRGQTRYVNTGDIIQFTQLILVPPFKKFRVSSINAIIKGQNNVRILQSWDCHKWKMEVRLRLPYLPDVDMATGTGNQMYHHLGHLGPGHLGHLGHLPSWSCTRCCGAGDKLFGVLISIQHTVLATFLYRVCWKLIYKEPFSYDCQLNTWLWKS